MLLTRARVLALVPRLNFHLGNCILTPTIAQFFALGMFVYLTVFFIDMLMLYIVRPLFSVTPISQLPLLTLHALLMKL